MTHSQLTIKIELACAEVLPNLPQPEPMGPQWSPRKRRKHNHEKIMKYIREAAKKHGIKEKHLVKIILR